MGIPTNTQAEYQRLRSYLSPTIAGPNTDSILTALAAGPSTYLINNLAAINDQLFIATASGNYLDELLAQYGITRPSSVGLSDEIFAQIGIEVKNRKQVRDLINNILDIIFGDDFTKATMDSTAIEPYALADGDDLFVSFDNGATSTIIFNTSSFVNIAAATAQEVADAITVSLNNQGLTGSAVVKNNGIGNYVELVSNTIGPSSSVTVFGGSAQNELLFPSVVPAGGNMSTQWTITLPAGGRVRFTWSGGANPNLGKVSAGNYVNIYGGGFASSDNEGSYTIIDSHGGTVNSSYFEIENPLGTAGIVTQGSEDAVTFYNPTRNTIISRISYAAVYQTKPSLLQIFLPATTQVVRRSRIGSAHVHYPATIAYTLNSQPNSGDSFQITANTLIQAGVNFAIGSTVNQTVANMASALADVTGIAAYANNNVLNVYLDSPSVTLSGTYSGSANIVPSGLQGDPISVQPNQPGPYTYDPTQGFTVSATNTTLAQELDATKPRIIQVADSSGFPNSTGYLVFDYGGENQEIVPYIATPSADTLLISPAYTVKNIFQPGTTVFLLDYLGPPQLSLSGSDYEFFVTGIADGRIYAQDLIESVAATGINILFTIIYPSDIGLGKAGTAYSEISYIYGP